MIRVTTMRSCCRGILIDETIGWRRRSRSHLRAVSECELVGEIGGGVSGVRRRLAGAEWLIVHQYLFRQSS